MGDKKTTVLIAMDGSKCSEYAFDFYMQNVHKKEDVTIMFNCFEYQAIPAIPMGVGNADVVSQMMQEQKEHSERYLALLTDKMKSNQLHGKVKQVQGEARREILRVAEEENATMIIMGTRGMGTVRRTLLGSVSDHIIHHSHVPVLVCRHKDDEHHHH